MSVHWVSGLERNLAHGESKSEELLLVQEGGLTLSRQVLMPRPSPPHSGSLRDAQFPIRKQQHFNSRSNIIIFFLTSDSRSAVLLAISDEKSFPRKGRGACCCSRPPTVPGRVTPNHLLLQRTPKIYKWFYE